jgi:HK97 family phage major capsid protein
LLRGLRDDQNRPIYVPGIREGGPTDQVWGINIDWVRNGSWVLADNDPDDVGAHFIAGDREAAILGLRQDMTFKFLTEATLTDGAGAVLMSLAEEDMIALRVKMRLGYQVADPTTIEGGSSAYPFAILAEPVIP